MIVFTQMIEICAAQHSTFTAKSAVISLTAVQTGREEKDKVINVPLNHKQEHFVLDTITLETDFPDNVPNENIVSNLRELQATKIHVDIETLFMCNYLVT